MTEINFFRGVYGFLSNTYMCEFIDDNGISYKSVEHYFQSHKTVDPDERNKIRCAEAPMESKRLGRKCQLRTHWEHMKDSIMEDALRLKFRNEDLKSKLIATHPYDLVEGNWWGDTYWGKVNGEGLNNLGILLMKIRKEAMNVKDDNEKVKYVKVTPENFDELKDDFKFPEDETGLKEFIKDNETYHNERIAKKQ
ncbi:NADAR family protein [Candidatus Dependentiae bacterium]|nr:NADAR family protein [Candidatus Dependentiae bacterium]